jgi:NAD(P)-dependent dehydrogenase (short-subunit alcohol dehydrogenase family)
MAASERVALVTGASRGIGAEIARQLERQGLTVVRGVRAPDPADPTQRRLDVTDQASVDALAAGIERDPGRLDVLVNNAGILLDTGRPGVGADLDVVRATLDTNLFGAWRVASAVAHLLRRSSHGRIVNVSSGLGQLADMRGGTPGYRMSKVSLNALTRIFAHELAADGVLVNSTCPGYVRTDMSGPGATRSPAEGADTAVWLVTLPDDGPTGGFFRDRRPIPW